MPWDDAELLRRAHLNVVESNRTIARHCPGGRVLEKGGVTFVATGVASPSLNQVFVMAQLAEPKLIVDTAREFYRELPWQLFVAPEAVGVIEAVATSEGLVPSEPEVAMLMAPLREGPGPVPDLVIRRLTDPAELVPYMDVLSAGFDMAGDLAEAIMSPALLDVPEVSLYLGFADGRSVATSASMANNRIAGVFSVATLPEYRRRGVGEAMTWAAIGGGRESACIASYLQASAIAHGVYERMGYRHVLDYHVWTPREFAE